MRGGPDLFRTFTTIFNDGASVTIMPRCVILTDKIERRDKIQERKNYIDQVKTTTVSSS